MTQPTGTLDELIRSLGERMGKMLVRRTAPLEDRIADLEAQVAALHRAQGGKAAATRRHAISADPDPDAAGITLVTFDDGAVWPVPDERLMKLAALPMVGRA